MDLKQKNPTAVLKKISNSIDHNRKNIEGNVDLTQNLQGIKANFAEIQGVVKNQSSGIDGMKKFSKEISSESSKNFQLKRFFLGFCDKAKVEFKGLFEVVKENFAVSLKSKSGETWQKIEKELEKNFSQLRDQSESAQKIYAAVNKIITAKDQFLTQFFKLMLYKKNILWRDLNAPYDDYIHGNIKNAINLIKSNQEKYGYVPSTLQFIIPRFQQQQVESNIGDLLKIAMSDTQELIDGLKNYSKLSTQPQVMQDISKNQVIIKGLRERIQFLSKNYQNLTQKYRALQINKGKAVNSATQQKSLLDKLDDMQGLMIKKQQQIIQLKQLGMKQDGLMNGMRQKNKQLQDQLSKWHKYQIPKIKQMQGNQRSILEQFNKVRRDLQTYSNMLQNERQQKIRTYDDLKVQRTRVHELVTILGRQRRKIKQLKSQIVRQQKIVLQVLQRVPDSK